MSFRRRITLASAAAVAVAVVLASLLTYVLVRNQLRGQIDTSLRDSAARIVRLSRTPLPPAGSAAVAAFGRPPSFDGGRTDGFGEAPGGARATVVVETPAGPRAVPAPFAPFFRQIPERPGQATTFGQLVGGSGQALVLPSSRGPALPVLPQTRAIATRGSGSTLSDAKVNGQHVRVLTVGLAPGRALELARSLGEVDSVLGRVRLILVLLAAGGIALAAVLGRFVSGAVVGPVRRLTDAAEHVAATRDLGRRIETGGRPRDELGRLAVSFNAMLDALAVSMRALDESARAQRQLVADASHELRTPVTSLRTNFEILQRADELPPSERERLIADVVEQLEELSTLVADLIDLARDDDRHEPAEELRLDTLVAEAIERTRRHAPQARFDAALEESVVSGVPARLDRAVNNLLDNAVKFGANGAPIEVRLHDGELTVRDHGPGIDPDELPHVFDRFFRGAKARALPGSGLGLAIVRQVADLHGGSVSAEAASGGGTIVRLRLPLL